MATYSFLDVNATLVGADLQLDGGWRLGGTVAALAALLFTWLTYGHPSYPLRLGSFTALMICIYAANLRFLLRHGGKRFPVRLVEVVLALHIAVLAVRLSTTLVGRAGSDLMEPSLYQTLYIGAYVLTVLMLLVYYGYVALIAFDKEFLAQPLSSSGVTCASGRWVGLPQSRYTASASVRISRASASIWRASRAAERSLSITASMPR